MAEMTQDEAMNMSNEQAVQILKPMMNMMRDQHGCPISDAYFAIEKAIRALSTVSPDEARGVGKWTLSKDYPGYAMCSCCEDAFVDPEWILRDGKWNYCPNCGARLTGGEND